MRHCAKTFAKNRQKGIEGNRQERSDGKKKFRDYPIEQDTQERRGKDRASFSGDVIDGKNKIKVPVSTHQFQLFRKICLLTLRGTKKTFL